MYYNILQNTVHNYKILEDIVCSTIIAWLQVVSSYIFSGKLIYWHIKFHAFKRTLEELAKKKKKDS